VVRSLIPEGVEHLRNRCGRHLAGAFRVAVLAGQVIDRHKAQLICAAVAAPPVLPLPWWRQNGPNSFTPAGNSIDFVADGSSAGSSVRSAVGCVRNGGVTGAVNGWTHSGEVDAGGRE
jgi:hypothetical protein